MDNTARSVRDVNDALLDVPMPDRLAALVCSIVTDEPRARQAVCDLVSVTGMLARQLPAAERLAVAWALLAEIEMISAKWN